MIKNSINKKYKYKAEDVMVGKINIIDYINNKIVKIQNDITSYIPYKFGGNFKDSTLSIGADYSPVPMSEISTYYGSELFEIGDNYISYIGSTPAANNQTFAKIDFTSNFSNENFTANETIWAKIKVVKKDGTTRSEAYISNSVINTNSRNEMSTFLISQLEKGDKIYFEYAIDNAKSVRVSKAHFSIELQQMVPKNYYEFKY